MYYNVRGAVILVKTILILLPFLAICSTSLAQVKHGFRLTVFALIGAFIFRAELRKVQHLAPTTSR